ncbi:hypothetical protein N7519_008915 [Penicillium mononematosum]|uniref:uncharacterized protein n=1 Tax=Penicillium mononematosum TaxID=268346 RepID=UPI002546BCFA|nr:uncharacterized protein N7519_008915 [Penicillium mononematosum]KAJ6178454.1 hypothetical protein N7519_008915 [Penicillium mononematosum]
MSEINVTAVFTPKPEKFEEVSTLVTEVIKRVQEHEPDTLLYYAYEIKDKNEIVIVERYKNQAAIQTHVKSPYFRTFSGKLSTLLTKPAEIRAGGFLSGSRGVSRI